MKVTADRFPCTWGECHDGASEPSTVIRLGRQVRRQEGTPMSAIILAAIIALLFVINARLNRRNPELEDYPRKPDGATTCGGRAAGPPSASARWQRRPAGCSPV